MRLLTYDDNGNLVLTRDLADGDIAPYAILSHTWGSDEEEVRLNEIGSEECRSKAGYGKITLCGQQARQDGVQFFWVDTCCIDKNNHVELSEAITSMFLWYQRAKFCYVYLADVSFNEHAPVRRSWKPSFRKSRWFTRGWTLQELLAPQHVIFYSKEWKCLGTKQTLKHLINEVTSIPLPVLENQPLSQFTVLERLRWAKGRTTKKKEDQAYCLLGIFNVYMYLNYGEGENAFVRLIQAINDLPKVTTSLKVVEKVTFDAYGLGYQGCHPATRVDLLQSIHEWAQDGNGKSIFWLNGMAGTGKSTISWTVANKLAHLRNTSSVVLGASFFFKRGEGDRASAALLFPTIAQQLTTTIAGFDTFLAQAVQADRDICDKSLGEQFKKLILGPAQELGSSAAHVNCVIVIDALDECESELDIQTILRLWSSLPLSGAVRLRLFLTSRPELVIRLGFKEMKDDLYRHVILHEIAEPVIYHDIFTYFSDALDEVRRNYNLGLDDDLESERIEESWPSHESLCKLTDMATPLFIVAATIHRLISDDEQPQQCLETILESQNRSHIAEIGPIYRLVLNGLTSSTRNSETIIRIQHEFRVIIGAIITLAEPLSRTALAALLGMKPADVHIRLRSLHAVLWVPLNGDALIQPLHLSFSEYLTSQEVQNETYWIDTKATHASLWRHCLQLLSSPGGLQENICRLKHPGQQRSAVLFAHIGQYLPSEVRYACRYWVHHVQQSNQPIKDDDPVHNFLKTHFLHWLEAMSLINRIFEVIVHLDILKSCISASNPNLSAFLEDARRFVLANIYIIDRAPLQLYSSSTIFAPKKSPVRSHCGQVPSWVKKYPRSPHQWSSELQKLEGHSGWVSALAFSPTGRFLVSGSLDHTVRLWDTHTGRELQKLECHSGYISAVVFSPDGALLASGSDDGIVCLWEVQTGSMLKKLEFNSGNVDVLTFSPCGTLLAFGLQDCSIRLHEMSGGQETQKLAGHAYDVKTLAFSSDGALLASGSSDRIIRLWETHTGREVRKLKGHTNSVEALSFSFDGTLLASGSSDRTIRLWEVSTGCEVQKPKRLSSWVRTVAFSPDGTILASGSMDNTVCLLDLSTGHKVQKLEGHTDDVRAVVFSPDGRLLASGSNDGITRLWETEVSRETEKLEGHLRKVTVVAISSTATLVASGSLDHMILLWDANTDCIIRKLEGHTGFIDAVAFSPDDKLLASASDDGSIRVWETSTGREVQQIRAYVRYISFSADGTNLFTNQDTYRVSGTDGSLNIKAVASTRSTIISISHDWIRINNQDLLWLPHEYRGISVIQGDLLAIGTPSGLINTFRFDLDCFQDDTKHDGE